MSCYSAEVWNENLQKVSESFFYFAPFCLNDFGTSLLPLMILFKYS